MDWPLGFPSLDGSLLKPKVSSSPWFPPWPLVLRVFVFFYNVSFAFYFEQ